MKPLASRVDRRGVTQVEVLCVVAVIAVLVALALPAVQRTRERARVMSCQNHLRQLSIATDLFIDSHGDGPGAAWLVYDLSAFLASSEGSGNDILLGKRAEPVSTVFECPSDPRTGPPNGQFSDYANDFLGDWSKKPGAIDRRSRTTPRGPGDARLMSSTPTPGSRSPVADREAT